MKSVDPEIFRYPAASLTCNRCQGSWVMLDDAIQGQRVLRCQSKGCGNMQFEGKTLGWGFRKKDGATEEVRNEPACKLNEETGQYHYTQPLCHSMGCPRPAEIGGYCKAHYGKVMKRKRKGQEKVTAPEVSCTEKSYNSNQTLIGVDPGEPSVPDPRGATITIHPSGEREAGTSEKPSTPSGKCPYCGDRVRPGDKTCGKDPCKKKRGADYGKKYYREVWSKHLLEMGVLTGSGRGARTEPNRPADGICPYCRDKPLSKRKDSSTCGALRCRYERYLELKNGRYRERIKPKLIEQGKLKGTREYPQGTKRSRRKVWQ